MRTLFTSFVFAVSFYAYASEPSYCTPANFFKKDMKLVNKKLQRIHGYQLGKVKLIGLGIGESPAQEVAQLAKTTGGLTEKDLYCTWYFNEGNSDAEKMFTHIYLPNPKSLSEKEAYEVYLQKTGNEFGKHALSFVSCAENSGYIAMGCNGMKHRGPTVFGMLLAYSGCSPQNASTIVNTIWDLNGIKAAVRLSAIQAAYDLGEKEPQLKASLQSLLTD